MGEHKHNPNVIAAKNGELPPKPRKMSAAERQMLLYSRIQSEVLKRTGLAPNILPEKYF